MGDFFTDTEPMVDPQHPGRYRCNLGENWNAFFAFGGATLAAAMRATSAHVDHPDLHPVGIHALFLHPVEVGPLVIDVETLRGGRRVQQLSATLHSATGDPALRMQGIWGSHEPDLVTGLGLRFPDVPLPDDPTMAPPEHSPEFGHLSINAQFDERHCPGSAVPGSLLDSERDATSAVWTRLGGEFHSGPTPFDPALLALYADRVPGPHLGRTITGHPTTNVPPRAIVTLELSLRIVGTPSSDWLLLEGSVPQAAGRYLTVRAVAWDETRRLVAVADQTARFASSVVEPPDPQTGTPPALAVERLGRVSDVHGRQARPVRTAVGGQPVRGGKA